MSTKGKRKPHAYALFVKKHYPAMRAKYRNPPDRIKEIARLWREHKKQNTSKRTEKKDKETGPPKNNKMRDAP